MREDMMHLEQGARSHRVNIDLEGLDRSLRGRYGELKWWWPAETPFEVCIGAILVQNTSWKNVEKAIANLKQSGAVSPKTLASLEQRDIEALVRPSGTYRQKARALSLFSLFVDSELEGDIMQLSRSPVEAARRSLMTLKGIGEETADAILLYACRMPVFVADSYSRRILGRLGLLRNGSTYRDARSYVERSMGRSAAAYARLHALIIEFGKEFCRSTPLCSDCFLLSECPYGRSASEKKKRVSEEKHEK